jgi:putative membrane protein
MARPWRHCAAASGEGSMSLIAKVLVGLIAVEHIYILCLEMFLWTTPRTRKSFGMTEQAAQDTKVLAANQGLYNGFLAAGLIWSLVAGPELGRPLALFFVACVLVAGIYGGFTATRRIFLIQALPALIALVAVLAT